MAYVDILPLVITAGGFLIFAAIENRHARKAG